MDDEIRYVPFEEEHEEEERYCKCGNKMNDEDFELCEDCNYEENQGLRDNSNDDIDPNESFYEDLDKLL